MSAGSLVSSLTPSQTLTGSDRGGPRGPRPGSDWTLPLRWGRWAQAGAEVGARGTRAYCVSAPCPGPTGSNPAGLVLGPGREVAFAGQKQDTSDTLGRGRDQHKCRGGSLGARPRRPPIPGRGAQGSVMVGSGCWGLGGLPGGGGLGLQKPVSSTPRPLETPVRPHLSALRPPAGVLSPGGGRAACLREEVRHGEHPVSVRDPERALTCGLEPGAQQGSHPSQFPRSGRFSEALQLLWAKFPRFLPTPSPTRPRRFLHASLRVSAHCARGGLGRISGWAGPAAGIGCRPGVPVPARAAGSCPTGTFPGGGGRWAALEKHWPLSPQKGAGGQWPQEGAPRPAGQGRRLGEPLRVSPTATRQPL